MSTLVPTPLIEAWLKPICSSLVCRQDLIAVWTAIIILLATRLVCAPTWTMLTIRVQARFIGGLNFTRGFMSAQLFYRTSKIPTWIVLGILIASSWCSNNNNNNYSNSSNKCKELILLAIKEIARFWAIGLFDFRSDEISWWVWESLWDWFLYEGVNFLRFENKDLFFCICKG